VFLGNGDGTFQPQVTYGVGSEPVGLVAGDFNRDGRTDLATANYGENDVSVLLGNGDGTFQTQVTYAVGSGPAALVSGDFTGDGRTDLAIANSGSNDVSVLLGNGDGTFQPQVTYAVGSEPQSLVSGNFTGDGRTDLAVANSGSNDVSVLLGNGDGTFGPQVTYAVGSDPLALVTGDFTGDGRTDLAVTNHNDNDVSVLLGHGDGTFGPQVTYAVGNDPQALVTGDFTGDGRTDLAVANSYSSDVSVLLGNGDGTFQTQVIYLAGNGPVALVAGDFTGDGRTDLAVSKYQDNDISVLLGNGDGTFQTQVTNAVGSTPYALVAGEFTGDGRTDLAIANFSSSDVSVLLGNGDGTFQTQVTYPVGSLPIALVAGDFNGDGRTDLAVANYGSNDVSVLLGNGDGTFQTQVTYAVGSGPDALVAGDFNGDGRTDLAVANQASNNVSVLLGNGDGTFQPQVTYAVGSDPQALVASDFNGDGRTDLAVANSGSSDVSVLLGNGDGTFQSQVTYAVGSDPFALVAGDFNGDGRTDLAIANQNDNDVSVLLGNGDGTFGPQVTYAVGKYPDALVAGDFTGDGRTDLATTNAADFDVSVLLGNGDGTFQPQVTYAAGLFPYGLVAGDFTGDGRIDLAFANSGSNNVSVLLNLNGTFAPAGSFVTNLQAAPLVANLTGDGVDDVFVVDGAGDILWRRGRPQEPGAFDPPITINPGHPSRDIVAVDTNEGPVLASVDATDDAISLYAWRDGSFALIGSLPTGSLPAQIVTADLTGDGWNDLVVRSAGDGTLSVDLNAGNESGPFTTLPPPFLTPVTMAVGPGVSDVTLADVSGDARTDIVVTDKTTGEVGVLRNLGPGVFAPPVLYAVGSGLYAVTSSSGPATLTTQEATAGVAAGALTAGDPVDLVATDPGTNTVGVLSGLGGGRFANPLTIPTTSPAIAILVADLEGNGIPDTIVLSNSGVTVYRGDGQGGFLPDPFSIAAGPEPTGMTLADINHDGKLDLLVGNAYGDLLVLLGNGDGTFQPYRSANQNVALAILPNGSPTPDFIYADQALDRVVVDYATGQMKTLADRTSGLLAPGAVVLADLNGDGIPDLIVANSGGNNVLVYPGLGNGQFGPELNGGKGFFTGTNPVGITVAKLNGRPDLVIANEGSNDVSILLNVATADGGFTFVPGPRLQAGLGPTSTVVEDGPGNVFPDLLVSASGSNDVRLLPGVGNGFFIDSGPQVKTFTLPAGSNPVQVMVGTFLPNQGPEILTVNRGSNDVTVISDFTSLTPVFDSFSTGGIEPVAAIAVTFSGEAQESLVVANEGDGLFTLLGGTDGLDLEQTQSKSYLPEPTALDLASLSGNEVSFYATTAGVEAAFTLNFILPGFSASVSPVPGSSSAIAEAPAQLLALSETSLALVGTLLVTMLNAPVVTVLNTPTSATLPVATGNLVEVNTTFAALAPSQGQGLFSQFTSREGAGDGEPVESEPEAPRGQAPAAPPWMRSVLALDDLFKEIRQENQDALFGKDEGEPAVDDAAPEHELGNPSGLLSPPTPAPQPAEPGPRLGQYDEISAEAVDAAIDALASVPRVSSPCVDSPVAETLGTEPPVESLPDDPAAKQRGGPGALGVLMATTTVMIVRANPPAGPGGKPVDRGPVGCAGAGTTKDRPDCRKVTR